MNLKKMILVASAVLILMLIKNTSVYAIENEEKKITNGTYTIKSALGNNLVLDITGASLEENANLEIWVDNKGNNQKFNVTYDNNGYYTLEVVNSGKVLSVENDNVKDCTNVVQKYKKNVDSQKWRIKDAGDGYFYIISKINNMNLDVYGAIAQAGTNIQVYTENKGNNQKFKFDKVDVVSGNKTIENGTYIISSEQNESKVLDIHGASKENKANLEIYGRNAGKNQKFKIEYLNNGYYKIEATHSGKLLTVRDSSIVGGANVEQDANKDIDAQKWVIKDAGNGYYYIISKCNNLYLDIHGGEAKDGTNIETYYPNYQKWQKFKFTNINISGSKTIESGNYVISTSMDRNKVLDVTGNVITNNENIELWDNNNSNNQKFIVSYLEDGYYSIKAFNSNKVLTIYNGNANSGGNVVQSYYTGSDFQKWVIEDAGNGYYYILSKCNGLALDVYGALTKNGTNIEVYNKNNGANQKFKFEKTEFSSTIADGKYAILASSNNNMVFDIEGASLEDGANLELWTSNGGANQSFTFNYLGNGYYNIKVNNSGKLLTLNKNGRIIQQSDANSDAQKWIVQKADSAGNYSIRSKENDNYIDIYYNDMRNGTKIQIFGGNDGPNQKFKLEELSYKGIDVSRYQKDTNWQAVKSSGVDFTMIRVGFRGYGTEGTLNLDPLFNQNINGALSNGIDCGIYFFSQAVNYNEGVEEAKWTLDKIKGYNITYPIAIDTEESSASDKTGRADNISKEDRTAAIRGFCETIRNAGYKPMIYASKYWLKDKLNMSDLQGYDVWLAHYVNGAPNNKSDYDGPYTMWQYTSSGYVNGINGEVDMNICYKKY